MARKPLERNQIIVGALLIALIASSWRMFSLEGQRHRIDQAYRRAQQELSRLQGARGSLEDELVGARSQAATAGEEVHTLRRELARLHKRLDETMAELTSTQREHEAVRQENLSLADQLKLVRAEKQQLEVRFSSIKELKSAIRTVQRKMRDRRLAGWRARLAAQKEKDQRLLAEGNRGYVVRDGKPTLGIGTKLHVRVLEPQSP